MFVETALFSLHWSDGCAVTLMIFSPSLVGSFATVLGQSLLNSSYNVGGFVQDRSD